MTKILWLSPTFNHYKARFLNHLAAAEGIELTLLAGAGRNENKNKGVDDNWSFKVIQTNVPKSKFGFSSQIRKLLSIEFKKHDWVLIPAEKKNLPLFLFALVLQFFRKKTKLISYNHPVLKSGEGKISFLDKQITKFFYKKLDRVIFYTKESCEWAVQNNYIRVKKAFWANNTVDDIEINKNYQFEFPSVDTFNILFIGRLIPSKKVGVLLHYFQELQNQMNETDLILEIIGDGMDSNLIQNAQIGNNKIKWHGTLTDEFDIAPIMKRTNFVFVPGLSGLSINHAFAYGRPYFTLQSKGHGPEIAYLKDNENGYVLSGDINDDVEKIKSFLLNKEKMSAFSLSAIEKSKEISVHKWVEKMKMAFINE